MKYWLLTSEYPPFYGGGISTYCRLTAQMLSGKGHDVSVFVYDYSVKNIKIQQADKVRLIRFNPSQTKSSSFLGYLTNISYEYAHIIKSFIEKEGKPDVIESQEYLGIAYYLLQYKYLLYDWCVGVPVVITVHSPSFLYHEYNHIPLYKYPDYWVAEMERFCLQAADLLISPSEYIIQEIKKRFEISHERLIIIPNPYFLEQQLSTRPAVNDGKPEEIIFYGKLTVQKGVLKLLDYFRKLWDEGFVHPLNLIGGGDIFYHPGNVTMNSFIKKNYKKYIQKGLLKLEGKIKPEKLLEKLSNVNIIIIPSVVDNLPYTVFEMMGMGKIVLVSKQGGQAEIIDDKVNGFIFDHTDAKTFFDQLNKILTLKETERIKISAGAIEKVSNRYSSNIIYEQKIEVIYRLISQTDSLKTRFPFLRPVGPYRPNKIDVSFEKKLLSIVITYYNSGKFIDEIIECLTKIEYTPLEIIIVDDGSYEFQSVQKLEFYKNRPGIKVISKQNAGLADTRNIGAESAKGEFLAFIDADDKIDKSYYSKAINILTQYNNVHFVGAWTKYFEGSTNVWPTFNPEPPIILYHNLINSAALVYKRNSFLIAGKNDPFMPFKGLEDYESIISMLEAGFNGVTLPEILFYYRVRHDSMIRDITTTKKLFISQYIYEKHKSFYTTFVPEIVGLLNTNGPAYNINNPTLDYSLLEKIGLGKKVSTSIVRLIKRNRYIRSAAYKLYKAIKK